MFLAVVFPVGYGGTIVGAAWNSVYSIACSVYCCGLDVNTCDVRYVVVERQAPNESWQRIICDQKFEENLFSRGQLQLLSFARAIVKDPEILLLDEISANLDTDSEKKLLLAIQNLKDKKTVLCISHRLNEALSFSSVISVENQKLNPQK